MPIISSPMYGIGVVAVAVGTALWAYKNRSSTEARSVNFDQNRTLYPSRSSSSTTNTTTTTTNNKLTRIPIDDEINPLPYKDIDRTNNNNNIAELRERRNTDLERSKYFGTRSGQDMKESGKSAIEGVKDESKLLKEESKSLLDRLLHGSSSTTVTPNTTTSVTTPSTVTDYPVPMTTTTTTSSAVSSTSPPSTAAESTKGFFSRLLHPSGASSSASSTAPIGTYTTSMLSSVELDVMRQEEEANNKRTAAEKLAAESAATLAAATSFKEKVAEDQLIAQQLEREAQLLKDAYLTKLNEAREAERLLKKDEVYRRDTERKSNELLKQEDRLLREAARAQELYENKKLLAEQTKYQLAQQQYREAENLRRHAENERLRALQMYEKEQEQVELARKRANEINERTRPTMTAEEANRRARALQDQENELSRRIAEMERERRNAIEQAKLATDLTNKRSRELLAAEQSVQVHEQALRKAAEWMKTNEDKAQAASDAAKRLEATVPKTTLPLKSNPVVAEANAEGEAHVQREYDPTHSLGSALGTTVTAKGKSVVQFRNASDEFPGPRGGYDSIQINREILSNNDTKANINLKESSRNEPHRRLTNNDDSNGLTTTPSND